jgi:two-component system, LuxR family, response regulator FixJ
VTGRPVYVVDDEEPIRRSLHLMLRTLKFAPRTFADGLKLLESLSELEIGCVLLDLRMPEIDGLEVQRRLLAAAAPHSVIVMSGHGDVGIALTAMEQGAIAFVEKPFARATLEQLLEIAFLRLEDHDGYAGHLRSAAADVGALCGDDLRVLDLLVRGHDLATIAVQARLAQPAVELARSRISARLGAPSLVDVLRIAFAARRAAML